MSTINFSDLQAAADETYGPFTVGMEDGSELRFLPVLRLPKEKREKITELQKRDDWATTDGLVENIKAFFELRAASKADYTKLNKLCGDDGAMWAKLFELAIAKEELGEA